MTQREAVERWWTEADDVTRRRALQLRPFGPLPADMRHDLAMQGVTVVPLEAGLDGTPSGYKMPRALGTFLRNQRRRHHVEGLAVKLQPDAMRLAMVRAGAVLTGYELVRTEIVDGVRGIYLNGFDEHGMTYSRRYDVEVLSLARNPVRASLLWLQQQGALTAEQVEAFEAVRKHRHEVAHELARFVVDPEADIDLDRLRDLRDCLRSLDRYIESLAMEANPNFDGAIVNNDEVRIGTMLLLDDLFELAELDEGSEPARPGGSVLARHDRHGDSNDDDDDQQHQPEQNRSHAPGIDGPRSVL
ncbi:hypothetical protein [Kineococcus sp. SYSU DK001]|uniref:hypothetical protein n=1 Tax=Kineococcus sp. SYSU DK001 TaxID=3383122 RepID=UPI003D7C45A2